MNSIKQGLIGLFISNIRAAETDFLGVIAAKNHPRVKASANTIDLDVRGDNDYYGPLFIGEEWNENHLVYDTMSDWTIIVGDATSGSSFPGNYDVTESQTAKTVYYDAAKTTVETATADLGSVSFNSLKFTEQMCLFQRRNDRTTLTGKWCV